MISTITTSTVSILTTSAIAGSLALIAILVLLALLVQKELATAADSRRLKTLSQVLNIAIAPLFVTFVLLVISKVVEVLQ